MTINLPNRPTGRRRIIGAVSVVAILLVGMLTVIPATAEAAPPTRCTADSTKVGATIEAKIERTALPDSVKARTRVWFETSDATCGPYMYHRIHGGGTDRYYYLIGYDDDGRRLDAARTQPKSDSDVLRSDMLDPAVTKVKVCTSYNKKSEATVLSGSRYKRCFPKEGTWRLPTRDGGLGSVAVGGATGAIAAGQGSAPQAGSPVEPRQEPRGRLSLPDRQLTTSVDGYGRVAPFACSDAQLAGTRAFAELLNMNMADSAGRPYGYGQNRSCNATWGIWESQHKTGRAVDFNVDSRISHERLDGMALLEWLFEGEDGVPHARLRRLGIVEIIWDARIWTAARDTAITNPDPATWRRYNGLECNQDPNKQGTACHYDHFHFTLSAEGSEKRSSWWGPDAVASSPQPGPVAVEPGPSQSHTLAEPDLRGPAEYWSSTPSCDHTHECGAVYTAAASGNAEQVNLAVWKFRDRSGHQHVECYIPARSANARVEYELWVDHVKSAEIVIDQSTSRGWTTIGNVVAGDSSIVEVVVRDNESSPRGASIGVDACRVSDRTGT